MLKLSVLEDRQKKYLIRKYFPMVSISAWGIFLNFELVVYKFTTSHFVHIKFIKNKTRIKITSEGQRAELSDAHELRGPRPVVTALPGQATSPWLLLTFMDSAQRCDLAKALT